MRLYSIRLLVEDFDACFRFYRDTLALEPIWGEEGGRYADFKASDGALLSLFKRDLMATTVGTQELRSDAPAQDRATIVLQTDDLNGVVSALLARGVTFVTELKDYPAWTIRAAHLRDPDGNLIELFMPLPKERWAEEAREADRRASDRVG